MNDHIDEKQTIDARGVRTVYEALRNDANDKRSHGSWKVCVREYDADGLMIRSQKYAQEIYSESHAQKIADALNQINEVEKMRLFVADSLLMLGSVQSRSNEGNLDAMEARARSFMSSTEAAEISQANDRAEYEEPAKLCVSCESRWAQFGNLCESCRGS